MNSVRSVILHTRAVAIVVAIVAAVSQAWATACSSPFAITELVNTAPFNGGAWVSQPVINSGICSPARAIVDGNGATHVYVMDQNNHLIEAHQEVIGGSWTFLDITNQVGGVTIQGVPAPLATGGSAVQVFVPSPAGHLLSFVNPGTETYQVADLSAAAASSASLVSLASPILFGSTVHVFVADNTGHLHDFYKPQAVQWTDQNFSVATGVAAVNPAAFAYGGNSIQIASRSSLNSDMEVFVQLVNPDGTFNGSPSAFDTTAVSGGTPISSVPSPIVVGSSSQDVAIFADDSRGHLVDYFKQPNPTQWVELDGANPLLGHTGLAPTALFFPNVGANGTVKVYSAASTSGGVQAVEYTGDPTTGAMNGFAINNGTIFSDVHAVVNNGVIEVFIPNSGSGSTSPSPSPTPLPRCVGNQCLPQN